MKHKIISTKTLLLIPLLFVLLLIFKIALSYYESQNRMEEFVQKQTQTLNQFMMVHRTYYQDLYLNKVIPLNQKTLQGLPAFSAFDISKKFSQQNHFSIEVQTVSNRARNEKNQADIQELKAIDFFKKNKEEKEYFSSEKGYFQYATPLFIEKKCLKCHGKKEDAPLFIQKKYTNAYNYKLGELRGIVSIKVPKKTIGSYFTGTFIQDAIFDMILLLIIFSITFYLIKYFRNLSANLKLEVDEKTNQLSHQIAFLESHQIAMDESSIVSKSDLKGNIIYVNDNFCKVSGYSKDEVIGKPHSILRHPDNSHEIFKELWETIKAKKVWKGVLKNKGKLEDYWVDISILPILDENKKVVEYIAVRHDITKMVKQQKILDDIVNTDILTGYGSRYKLIQNIESSLSPALAIINIDNFTQINDFYGHEKGDIVIRKLGDILADITKNERCELYHLQGDEYVVFNTNIDKYLFAKKMDSLISKVQETKIYLDEEELDLNFSVAISFEHKSKILITADMALKVAKKENKHLLIYNDTISLNKEYENNIKWTKKIKQAIKDDSFVPVFQPIINNTNHKWEKYECLVRMKDEDQLISPYFFLEISKKTKHYVAISKVMIGKSFEVFKNRDEEFSINLTIEDILNEDINQYIIELLKKYNIGSRVVFEIVESESIENFDEIHKFIQKVKSYGCQIAIDDFGTGYSNFEYLLKLKANYIKIDGSMIKDIDVNEETQLLVATIIDFANKMDMKTIAEYVENESILNKIKELGIDYSQGYYFSAPKTEIEN